MPHITFSLSPDLKTRLEEAVNAEDGNKSRFISQSLEAYLSGTLTYASEFDKSDTTFNKSDTTRDTTFDTTDTTQILLLKREVEHKDELLKTKDELIFTYRALVRRGQTQLTEGTPLENEDLLVEQDKKPGMWQRIMAVFR